MQLNTLKELCETPGVPGYESRVRDYIKESIKDYVDEMHVDPMGNLHAVRYSDASERLMIACHMDEIGFIVNYVTDDGFIHVQPLGGFDPRNLFSRRVLVCTDDGDFKGVMNPSGLPVHLSKPEDRKVIPAADEFIIDIGCDANGKVSIGDFVVMDEPYTEMGDKVVSKALDNRVACFLGIELLRSLENVDPAYEVHVVFTVQEEVGLRGAKTATCHVYPDISIGVDVTLACDTPGVPASKRTSIHGAGFALGIRDSSFISDKALVEEIEKLATDNHIPYQKVVSAGGGMDGAAMQQSVQGSRAVAISVGTRYVHTVTEMVDKKDLHAALSILKLFVKS